jgi:hypothetical protein
MMENATSITTQDIANWLTSEAEDEAVEKAIATLASDLHPDLNLSTQWVQNHSENLRKVFPGVNLEHVDFVACLASTIECMVSQSLSVPMSDNQISLLRKRAILTLGSVPGAWVGFS